MDTNQQNSSQSFQDYKTSIGHYNTLTEALGAAMLKGNLVWRIFDETREPYNLVEIYNFAKKYDREHPITGTQFYWVSQEGAIGISMGLEYRVKWLFTPMEPGLELDNLVVKMGEKLAEVEEVKSALAPNTEANAVVPPPILPSEPTMPSQPAPLPEPVQGMPVVGTPVLGQPIPEPIPEPQPAPQPLPLPEPVEQPAPLPEPVQEMPVVGTPVVGQPIPEPIPEPQPAPQPLPEPVEQPAPLPEPVQEMPVVGTPVVGQPIPEPAPQPQPQPEPEPQPVPQPVPAQPQPVQQPAPQPIQQSAQPMSQPAPQPVQQPAQPMPQPAPQPVQQPVQPMPQPAPQPPVQQPMPPVQQPAQPVQQPIAQSGSKSKLPMIIGGVVAAMLIAGGGYFAYNHFVGSKEAPAQQEEVTTTTTESENPTNEPAAQPASDAKALTTAAISDLKSASTAQQGIDKLNQAIAKGGKESVEALYTLAQLYGRVYSDKAVLANVEKLLPKDTKKAHELNEKAVALNNTFYPSLYELGCDYMAGDARGAVDRDIDKAKEYFTQGIKYAQQANDTQLAERFEIRLSSLE